MPLLPIPQTLYRVETIHDDVFFLLADTLCEAACDAEDYVEEGDEVFAIIIAGGPLVMDRDEIEEGVTGEGEEQNEGEGGPKTMGRN